MYCAAGDSPVKSPPGVIPLGADALDWVKRGGAPSRVRWVHRLLYEWQGFWFEKNLALQRRLHPAVPLDSDPIFVLGLWRSGTTFLHDLLSACPGVIYPATWQCMGPSTFRLRRRPSTSRTTLRPMDDLPIDAFSPQEDEFALLALGVPSVYRGFLDPRRLQELAQWLDPEAWDLDRPGDWVAIWREFLEGVADRQPGRLLLKSPGHTFRIRALLNVFPAASYVWVVREPEEVFLSNRKMWASMFRHYAMWDWESSHLDQFLLCALKSATKSLLYATRSLPTERLVVLDFRQLTGDAVRSVDGLSRRLGFSTLQQTRQQLTKIAADRSAYRADSYAGQELPSASSEVIGVLRAAQSAALASHGLA